MTISNDVRGELRNYLLGQVGEDQQQQIEQRLLTDDDFFEELEIVEDELIDDYIDGDVSPADCQFFEQSFLVSPERQAKLRFAKTLAALPIPVPPPPQHGWLEKLKALWNNQSWMLRAATAGTAAIVIAVLIWSARPPSPKTFATVALTLSTSERSQGGEATKLGLPLSTDALRLQLLLPAGATRAPAYRVELLRANGERETLAPVEQNDQAVTVELSSSQISRGQYALNLYAIRADKTEERIRGSFLLTVE